MIKHSVEITMVAKKGMLVSGLPLYVEMVKKIVHDHLKDVGMNHVNRDKELLYRLVMEAFDIDWTLVFQFDCAEMTADGLAVAEIHVVDNVVAPAIAVSLFDFVLHTGGLAGAEQYLTDEDGNVVGINVVGDGIPPALAAVSTSRSEVERAMYDELISQAEEIVRNGA